jgi:dihydrofolate reductase
MAKLISSILITLDGFVADPNGELDMFNVEQEFFDISEKLTAAAGTALYGRGIYHVMDNYWPTAPDKPNATAHDKNHGAWYKAVEKIVLSTTLKSNSPDTRVISTGIANEINKLKHEREKNIQIFGSPGVVRSLTQLGLIDEYWFFIAPIIIGQGMPLFTGSKERLKLCLLSSRSLASGLVALHYEK